MKPVQNIYMYVLNNNKFNSEEDIIIVFEKKISSTKIKKTISY